MTDTQANEEWVELKLPAHLKGGTRIIAVVNPDGHEIKAWIRHDDLADDPGSATSDPPRYTPQP